MSTMPPRALAALTLALFCLLPARADQPPARPPDKLPLSGLAPARVLPNLCVLHYRIGTTSPECQALFDQGLGFYYSYVWMEAARSFETATEYDPDSAIAWWGLSRALEKWSKNNHNQALEKAQALLPKAGDRERLLITARLQEKGMWPGVTPAKRRSSATHTLDELLTLYDDDTEGWFCRAQLSDGGVDAVPYYKALLRVDPLHPGANHELLHFYENYQRPALGWVYAENYIKSSPGIPHPFHMQAHLATRLGRWDKTSDRSAHAIELERAYQKEMNVAPKDDYQFPHHLEVLTLSLIHDGRFKEARAIKQEAWGHGYRFWLPWFRLHLTERDWAEAAKVIEEFRRTDKLTASYLAALLYLKQGDLARAQAEVEVLQEAFRHHKNDAQLEYRLWETSGLLMCATDGGDAGLKLLAKAVERSKNDYYHHSWGNGAYYMEAWGTGALQAGRSDVAEEAFLEALAHDPGSMRGALGLQLLCESQGRGEEAARYAELARRCWRHADPGLLEVELAEMRKEDSPQRHQEHKEQHKEKQATGGSS
jgi:tetratricopeptide (TPR) repeat protein